MAVIAPALDRLRSELNKKWPSRDRRTDGWIGDTSHQTSGMPENGGSDHNPNRRGVVDAFDIDVDGIDCPAVVAKAIRHPSTNYVIWSRRIWSRSRNFENRAYTGSNPHTDHIHVSLIQSVTAENSGTSWGIAAVTGTPVTNPGGAVEPSWAQRLAGALPELEKGPVTRGSVRKLQALLNVFGAGLDVDGDFGELTAAAVRNYQGANGLAADGIVGPKTWGKLIGPMPTTKRGDGGEHVKRIQSLLNVFEPGVDVDGDFGLATAATVARFQVKFGLAADTVMGPVTWTALLTR